MRMKIGKSLIILLSTVIAAMLVLAGAFMLAPKLKAHADTEDEITITAQVFDKFGGTSTFLSIEDAWNFANGYSPATLTLLTDVETTDTLTVESGKDITLDLNGKMLKFTGNSGSVISVAGNFTLKDGTPDSTHYYTVDSTGLWVFGTATAETPDANEFKGGLITGGNANQSGGGVCVESGGGFYMESGAICGNSAHCGGGVDLDNGAVEFVMENGQISGNTARSSTGGGVAVYGGKFVMYDGIISYNKTFVTVAEFVGGGVCAACDFEMYGGKICNNTSGGDGGGVYVSTLCTFKVSGAPEIYGNIKSDGSENNVYLDKFSGMDAKITVAGALEKDGNKAQIGITYAGGAGDIATGYTGENNPSGKKPSNYFIPDDKTYNCVYVRDVTSGTVSIAEHNNNASGECENCHATQDLFWGFADGVLTLSSYASNPATPYNYKRISGAPHWFADGDTIDNITVSVTVDGYAYAPQFMSNWFCHFHNLVIADLRGLDTSRVTDMGAMFQGCESLTSVNLSTLDTANVTAMDFMFHGCNELTELDLSSFSTVSLLTANKMFYDCNNLNVIHTPMTVGSFVLPLPCNFWDSDADSDADDSVKFTDSITSANENHTIYRHAGHTGGTATCTQLAECEICGNEYGDFGDHDWASDWTYDDETHWHACNNGCNEKNGEAMHSGTDDNDCTTAVTCTCGYVITAAETEHFFTTTWTTDENQHWHVCQNTGCTQTDTKVNHGGTDDNDCTTRSICLYCSYTITAAEAEHNYSTTWTTDENQHWHVCQNTGCTQTDTKADHEYTETVATETYLKSAATCTAKAVYYKSCVCGKYGTETFENGEALGHDIITHEAQQPTCTENGWEEYVSCSRCDYSTDKVEISTLGHTEVTDGNAVAATCTQTGLTASTSCSVCGTVLSEQTTIAALGHTEVTDGNAVAATCTQTGLTASKSCSVCGTVLSEQTTVAALGHTEVTDGNAVAATCTQTGLAASKSCSVCGTVLSEQTTIAALGHNFGEWTVTKEATESEDGEERRVCANDNTHYETRTIPKLTSSTPTPTPDNGGGDVEDNTQDGLPTGAIIAIIIACVLAALTALYGVGYVLYRKEILPEGKFFDAIYAPMNAIFKKKD